MTEGSLDKVLKVMLVDNYKNDRALQRFLPCRIYEDSLFLDVGSGAGQVVMMTAAKIGCRSHGIEVIQNRHLVAVEFMRDMLQKGSVPEHFGHLVSFEHENAALVENGVSIVKPFLIDGLHATHIFINNLVFSPTNNEDIAKRLNVTDFKMLVWCCSEKKTESLGLKELVKMCDVDVSITGSKYKLHIYCNPASCTLMDIVKAREFDEDDSILNNAIYYNVVKHKSVMDIQDGMRLTPLKSFMSANHAEQVCAILHEHLSIHHPVLWDSEITVVSQLQMLQALTAPTKRDMAKLCGTSKVLIVGGSVLSLALSVAIELNCEVDVLILDTGYQMKQAITHCMTMLKATKNRDWTQKIRFLNQKAFEKEREYTHAFLVSYKVEALPVTSRLYSLVSKVKAQVVITNVNVTLLNAHNLPGRFNYSYQMEVFLNGLGIERFYLFYIGLGKESQVDVTQKAACAMAKFLMAEMG